MAVMIELCRSCGRGSRNAGPVIVSYGIVWPVAVSVAVRLMMIRVIRACAGGAQASSARPTATMTDADLTRSECSDMMKPSTLSVLTRFRADQSVRDAHRGEARRGGRNGPGRPEPLVVLPATMMVIVIVVVVVTPLATQLRRGL